MHGIADGPNRRNVEKDCRARVVTKASQNLERLRPLWRAFLRMASCSMPPTNCIRPELPCEMRGQRKPRLAENSLSPLFDLGKAEQDLRWMPKGGKFANLDQNIVAGTGKSWGSRACDPEPAVPASGMSMQSIPVQEEAKGKQWDMKSKPKGHQTRKRKPKANKVGVMLQGHVHW